MGEDDIFENALSISHNLSFPGVELAFTGFHNSRGTLLVRKITTGKSEILQLKAGVGLGTVAIDPMLQYSFIYP